MDLLIALVIEWSSATKVIIWDELAGAVGARLKTTRRGLVRDMNANI